MGALEAVITDVLLVQADGLSSPFSIPRFTPELLSTVRFLLFWRFYLMSAILAGIRLRICAVYLRVIHPKTFLCVSAFEWTFDDDDDDSGGRLQRGC